MGVYLTAPGVFCGSGEGILPRVSAIPVEVLWDYAASGFLIRVVRI